MRVHVERVRKPDHTIARFQETLAHDLYVLPGTEGTPMTTASVAFNHTIAVAAFAATPRGLPSRLQQSWQRSHCCYFHANQPTIRLKVPRQQCWGAGRCICKPERLAIVKFRKSLLVSLSTRFPDKNARRNLNDGMVVLRLAAMTPGSDIARVSCVLWYHVSMMYYKPYRPTLLHMCQHDPELDLTTAGIEGPAEATLQPHVSDDVCSWVTLWQVVDRLDLDLEWHLSCYELKTSQLPVRRICPGTILVKRREDVDLAGLIWRGPPDRPQPGRRRPDTG